MEALSNAGDPDEPVGEAAAVGWSTLREWIDLVAADGQLKTITEPVSLDEELSAITLLASQQGEGAPALLFEHIEGGRLGARVLSNMLGASKERYALSVGLDARAHVGDLITATRHLMNRRIKPRYISKEEASVNENILTGSEIDLTIFPAPKFWPGDGGHYIGSGDITFTRAPDGERINVGCYRQMLHDKNRVGMYCSPGKHGRLDREAWWRQGKSCEVVAAYGIDPVLFMVAAQGFRGSLSELDVAGGMMGRPVELTEAECVSLPIPAHAEIVVEGLLHPGDDQLEGPLGEFTGYYGNERAMQPVIEVKAVHYRNAPILTAALMAKFPSCEIGAYAAIMRSANIINDLERIGVGGVISVYSHPAAASGWGMVIVSMRQQYAGHAAQVLALTAQCPAAAYFTKWIIAVDDDVDPTDFNQVMWALSTRCHPAEDLDILRNTWSTGLDPSQYPPESRPYGSKVLVNACKPHRSLRQFPRATALRKSTYDRVVRRWNSLGFTGEAPKVVAFHEDNL